MSIPSDVVDCVPRDVDGADAGRTLSLSRCCRIASVDCVNAASQASATMLTSSRCLDVGLGLRTVIEILGRSLGRALVVREDKRSGPD